MKKFKAMQVKAMHECVMCANDENLYMNWVLTVPDEPTKEDFEDIADDKKMYNEVCDLFVRIISNKNWRVR